MSEELKIKSLKFQALKNHWTAEGWSSRLDILENTAFDDKTWKLIHNFLEHTEYKLVFCHSKIYNQKFTSHGGTRP